MSEELVMRLQAVASRAQVLAMDAKRNAFWHRADLDAAINELIAELEKAKRAQ